MARCTQALAEVDELTCQHARLSAEVAAAQQLLAPAAARCAAAEQAQSHIDVLRDELRTAEVELDAARLAQAAAAAAHQDRLRLRADIDARAAAVTAAASAAAEAQEAEAVGRDMVATAELAAAAAAEQLAVAQDRADAARACVTTLSDRDEADRLSARLARSTAWPASWRRCAPSCSRSHCRRASSAVSRRLPPPSRSPAAGSRWWPHGCTSPRSRR